MSKGKLKKSPAVPAVSQSGVTLGWLLGWAALLAACASNPPPPVDTPQTLPPAEPSADLTKAPPEPGGPPPADAPAKDDKPQPEQ